MRIHDVDLNCQIEKSFKAFNAGRYFGSKHSLSCLGFFVHSLTKMLNYNAMQTMMKQKLMY
jgi:hypothetical protein